jgi:hypothetical protein
VRYREIVESIERITLGGWSKGQELTALVNPAERELIAALDRSRHDLRGLVDNNDSYWWEAFQATHDQVAKALGVSELSPGFRLFRSIQGTPLIQASNHNDQFATFACRSLQHLLGSGRILLDIGNQTATLADHLAASRKHEVVESADFPVDAYHGTGSGEITAFRPKNLKGRGGHLLDIGIHVSEDPQLASEYAQAAEADPTWARYRKGLSADMQLGAPTVYPLRVDPGHILDLTGRDVPDDLKDAYAKAYGEIASPTTVKRWTQALGYDPVTALSHYQQKAGRRALYRLIRGLGYDSIRYNFGISRGATNYVIFDPKRIRSRFANFDPAKRDSANLMDSVQD